ncbi:MAG: PEGA domain-containing protein [Endomicrobia bacterium]|nr:PEGA domain-containing protein [Endomicrobiia bacterium]
MSENKSQQGLDLGLFINDQYVTVKKIGQGGMGVVWQAYDFSLRNFIAVKELLSEFSEPKFVEMFYKEALIAKNIIHDNIVRVQHFWKGSNGSFYISMDFVRGVDLEDLIRRCNELKIKIPWELSVLICISMLKAIDYANRVARDSITGKPYGIVYRDISPGNVLISFDGNVKLSDFGIAKTSDEINDGPKQNVVTGKYPYMSPEQIKGISDIDHRADIFSIGVVFYEMLAGKQLYSGDNSEIKHQVLTQKFDTGLLSGIQLPYEIGEILSKSLEKDRGMRYERAIEMYRDLRRLLKGVETEELAVDLASFLSRVMEKELKASDETVSLVKTFDRQEIKNNTAIPRILCTDFIVGETSEPAIVPVIPPAAPPAQAGNNAAPKEVFPKTADGNVQPQAQQQTAMPPETQPQQPKTFTPPPAAYQAVPQPSQPEAKGKTVFEEVGDWLVTKFKEMKNRIIKIVIAVILAVLLFFALDIFMQITSFGKRIYSWLYPPDVVITTIPAGATVSMKTKEGEVIIQNANSSTPIPLRQVQPQTYVVTALKEGFRPVQKVVRIEDRTSKSNKDKSEKIEIMFDFLLDVASEPSGADVYVDGNKFGVTPCKIQLMAGEHTVRLALAGFEDLGSKAKESKEGQCNIDFSKPNNDEMFVGVDKRFWQTELKNVDGENVFSIKGHMYKKFTFTSVPENMIIHIEGEGQPRGHTPKTVNMKAGSYKVRMLDPEGRYGESANNIVVSANSDPELYVHMNKLISFRVKAKDNPSESFMAKLTIHGKEFNTTKPLGTGKPITVPLPSGKYDFTFTADEFRTYSIKDIDIAGISSVTGNMEYARVPFTVKIVAMDGDKEIILENAYIWLDSKLVGKTNEKGSWTKDVYPGKVKGKIVVKDYDEQSFEKSVSSGKGDTIKIVMIPSEPLPPEIEPEPVPDLVPDDKEQQNKEKIKRLREKFSPKEANALAKVKININDDNVLAEYLRNNDWNVQKAYNEIKKKIPPVPPPVEEGVVIVCPHCGYINTVPKGRRIRFCVNCARPLR